MMRPLFYLFIISLFSPTLSLFAQEHSLFMPSEIENAYQEGTRSYDGKPGAHYWQNMADYKIDVRVFPNEKKIEGSEELTYYNNSPDILDEIIIRLYHDVFKKGNPRSKKVKAEDINDGVNLKSLLINGESYELSDNELISRNGTNMQVELKEPLLAGGQLVLEIEWSQQIPETIIKTGAYDSTSFFVAYWYPQLAVYDDLFGWDDLPYDFSTEFYNNLANFDVTIKVPESFSVLATGVLQNPGEVLNDTILSRYQQAKKSEDPVFILKPEEANPEFKHRSGTWHYKANHVTDFSFCMSDHYSWEAASQKIDDRSVLIHSYFPSSKAEECKDLTIDQQKIMKYFSEDLPGIPYPYPEFTTFINDRTIGGMESPMMANNGGPGVELSIHEMFHTYFPMYVRVNEKRFAWMDEGWADFNGDYINQRHFKENDGSSFLPFYLYHSVNSKLGGIGDLPLITSTQFMDESNSRYSIYDLPAFLFTLLHHHLGDSLFKSCYQTYIKRWAKKSPSPYDLFYTFEDVSGQDLSWLWKPWFFNFGTVDVSIESFKKGELHVKNKGSRPVPIFVDITFKNGEKSEKSVSASAWNNNSSAKLSLQRFEEIETLEVNRGIPDANPMDNFFPSIQERYKKIDAYDSMVGKFQRTERSLIAQIDKAENGYILTIAFLKVYLLPISNTIFESLDGFVQIELEIEENKCVGIKFDIDDLGISSVMKKM